MITVSEQAAKMLFQALRESLTSPGKALRLRMRDENYTLDLDTPKEDDRVLRYSDSILLLVAPDVEKTLGDALIDVEQGPGEPRLAIRQQTQQSPPGTSGDGARPSA